MSVLKKIMECRIDLQNAKLKKTGYNSYSQYYYFELGDFLPAIQQMFLNKNMSGIVSFGTELASLTITDLDDNSSIVITSPMSTAALKGCHAVQNLGAVETYIRRYLWVAALEIVEHDAIDSSKPVDPLDLLKTTYADKGIDAARSVYAKMSKQERDQCSEFVETLKAA